MDNQNSNSNNNPPPNPTPLGPTPTDGFTSLPSQAPPADTSDPNSFNQPPVAPQAPVEPPQMPTPPPAPTQDFNPQSSFNQIPSLDPNLANSVPPIQDNSAQPAPPPPEPPPAPPAAENPIPTFLDQTPQNTQPADLANQAAALNQALNNPAPANPPTTGWGDVPNNPTPPISSEPAPTDLSQLTGNNELAGVPPPDVFVPPTTPAENLVVPAMSPNPEAVGTTAPGGHKMTKLLIGGGVVVVLLVIAASAYFILGVGRNDESNTPESTQSLPAQQAPLTNPPRQVIAPPTPEPSEEASASGSLGSLTTGGTASASASPTSALERLRQRQNQ